MWRRFRPPLVVVAAALFGLIVLLAVFQYRWLGQISEAERDRLRTGVATAATEFAMDVDREVARAFLLFQHDGSEGQDDARTLERFAARYDRWQGSARFPRLLKNFYLASEDAPGSLKLERFDPAARRFEPAEWPAAMAEWRKQLASEDIKESGPGNAFFIRRMPPAIWEDVPAIVVPTPMIFVARSQPTIDISRRASYSVLTIDLDYVSRELLPSLAERHFNHAGAGVDYQVAVVSRAQKGKVIFQSSAAFAPSPDALADASVDFLQVRPQDFTTLAAEVRRFTSFAASRLEPAATDSTSRIAIAESRPLSILIKPGAGGGAQGTFVHPTSPGRGLRGTMTETRVTTSSGASAHWKLIVSHRSGSLDAAVASQRRRNLAISSSILGLLGASMALLVLATRRAQRLARQQMEFVAAVSHELRTPLAVIRSAAENLADGVVHDEERIKRYGELMRTEGRRLTEMVEQILELAGIQAGRRGFALRPVRIDALLESIVASSSSLIENAGLTVESDVPADLPPVLGDEPALRRVFQNLVDNAIKYGASGGWIGLSARASGSQVIVTVADRGIGIAPAEQDRIFEPFYRAADVVAAQMQGAGLGLSLVQRIVLAHGGRVSVKSAPGNGSAFTVQIPEAAVDAAGEPAPLAPPPADAAGVHAARTP
jgi:signal transduction histidine kinase